MHSKLLLLLASLGSGALLHSSSSAAPQAPSLGQAAGFAVLGGSTVTNTGASLLTGDLGVSPGLAITGFPPGIVTGAIHAGDALALQAQADLAAAYDALAGAACTAVLTGQDLGGLTLTPGVYCFAASAPLNGVLTLDALGDPNAVFIFQIGSTLLPALGASVQMVQGGRAANVYWQVGSSATLAEDVAFTGNIVALTSITLSVGSSVSGRALARNGAVTMDTGSVSVPPSGGCETPASAFAILSGCGVPAPLLTCTPPVMGQPTHVGLDGTVAFVPGFIRVSRFEAPIGSADDCHVFLNSSTFVLASFVTDVNGDASFDSPVPGGPRFCGSRWVMQAVILAPSGTRRYSASNALFLTLGF